MDMEGVPWLRAHVTLPPAPGAGRGGSFLLAAWGGRERPVVLLQALAPPGRPASSGQVLGALPAIPMKKNRVRGGSPFF